jgi:hypothetical protein
MLVSRFRLIFGLVIAGVVLSACGGSGTGDRRTTRPDTSRPGEACASAVADEFLRQQELVYWRVYCPSELPDGFRLAALDDPPDPSHLGGDVTPTRDDLNPGGGTFITRLLGPGGKELVLVQGAGANIFVLRDATGRLIGDDAQSDSAFGDLEGRLFRGPASRVTAFDAHGYGHMLIGSGVDADVVAQLAAAMRPVDPSGLRAALFSLGDLFGVSQGWVVSWAPDSTGEEVANPQICRTPVDPGSRTGEAVAKFETAAPAGMAPDAGGHGPFLQQAVLRFSGDDARAYVHAISAAAAACTPATSTAGTTVATSVIDAPTLGDESIVLLRSVRSPVQGADADIAIVRRGAYVAVVLHWQTVPVGGSSDGNAVLPYARIADEKLRVVADNVVVRGHEPAGANASPTPDAAARARIVQGLPVAPFASNFDYVPYDWSPDGRRIAFIGDGLALYIAEPPAYTPQLLAGGPASEPRWSPDGKIIAFDAGGVESNTGDGIDVVSPDSIGGRVAQRVSPADDEWRGRIVQVYRWLDDRTIAYDVHCGCQMLFEMTVDRPADGSAPSTAGVVRQVPFVRTCADCITAALAFHYSPDGRYVVADTGTQPSLASYERAGDTQWLVVCGDDAPGAEIFRQFVSWDADSRTFVYREVIGTSPFADPPPLWTYWRADPATHVREPIPTESGGKPTGDAALDHLIGATLAGDKDALVAALGYTKLGCVRPQQEGTPPGCLEGEADGTLVDSFLTSGCGGGYERPDFAERVLRHAVPGAVRE